MLKEVCAWVLQIGALDVDWRQRLQGEELLQLRLQQLQFERKKTQLEAELREKVRFGWGRQQICTLGFFSFKKCENAAELGKPVERESL